MEEEKESGLFLVHGSWDYIAYDKSSLFLLHHKTSIRYALVWLCEWKWFERFITAVIIMNSILMASHDFRGRYDPDHISQFNNVEA